MQQLSENAYEDDPHFGNEVPFVQSDITTATLILDAIIIMPKLDVPQSLTINGNMSSARRRPTCLHPCPPRTHCGLCFTGGVTFECAPIVNELLNALFPIDITPFHDKCFDRQRRHQSVGTSTPRLTVVLLPRPCSPPFWPCNGTKGHAYPTYTTGIK